MLDLLIIAICLGLNAFFSAYEMAFVTVSREELDELADKSKFLLGRFAYFKKRPERTLSVIQIGITLVGAIAAAVGGTGAVESLEPYFVERFGLSHSFAEAISVSLVIVPLTYFSVVFGELLPKTIALRHPLKVIVIGTNVLGIIDKLLSPIVSFLAFSTHRLLRVLKLPETQTEDESMGETVNIGNLPPYHQQFVQNLVSLKGRRVAKSMIPLEKVQYLNFGESEEEIREKIKKTPHSRFPVLDDDVIVGVLYRKDLPDFQDHEQNPWQGNLRQATTVQEEEKVLEAFLKMQERQTPLAVVKGANDKIAGIITIEDIIEGIVGDIFDRADYSITSKMLSNRPRINLRK